MDTNECHNPFLDGRIPFEQGDGFGRYKRGPNSIPCWWQMTDSNCLGLKLMRTSARLNSYLADTWLKMRWICSVWDGQIWSVWNGRTTEWWMSVRLNSVMSHGFHTRLASAPDWHLSSYYNYFIASWKIHSSTRELAPKISSVAGRPTC